MIIFLNKTAPAGKSGDSMLLLSLQTISNKPIANWTYPSAKLLNTSSRSNQSSQPEIIELCSQLFNQRCNESCVLIIGVMGLTAGKVSTYRIAVRT